MREKIEKEIEVLSDKEAEQLFENLKGIFEGGVTISDHKKLNDNMTEYYKKSINL